MTKTLKTAIIGLGNIGQAVAANLAKSNTPFIVADRNFAKAQGLAAKLGNTVTPSDIANALTNADIVVLSIPFGAIGDFMKQYNTQLEGKIIIDPSNPIAPDEKGGFKKIINPNTSAGQINVEYLPKNSKLAKALGTLSAASLTTSAFQSPEKSVLFYATDDTSINDKVEQLIADTGFDAVRIGKIDQSIRIEVFGDLHEFGALGKTVTALEANTKI